MRGQAQPLSPRSQIRKEDRLVFVEADLPTALSDGPLGQLDTAARALASIASSAAYPQALPISQELRLGELLWTLAEAASGSSDGRRLSKLTALLRATSQELTGLGTNASSGRLEGKALRTAVSEALLRAVRQLASLKGQVGEPEWAADLSKPNLSLVVHRVLPADS